MVESGVPLLGALPSLGNLQSCITLKVQETVTLLPVPAMFKETLHLRALLVLLLGFFQKRILSLCSYWPIALPCRSIIPVATSLKSSNVTSA